MLKTELQRLRINGSLEEARALIRSQPDFDESPSVQRLLHEHEEFWWAPIVGKRVTLRRRGPRDAAFVRECWADADFMSKFNRLARPLPLADAALAEILARERAAILGESNALHWTIHGSEVPIGFVSATNYSAQHRRCEFLVGVLRQPPSPRPIEAARLAVAFLRDRVGIERLTAYFYPENGHAMKVARKFGFMPEGILKGYIAHGGSGRGDLLVAGMLLTKDAANPP
jgi:RimJ/RimL family protein N-acetyltransferase